MWERNVQHAIAGSDWNSQRIAGSRDAGEQDPKRDDYTQTLDDEK